MEYSKRIAFENIKRKRNLRFRCQLRLRSVNSATKEWSYEFLKKFKAYKKFYRKNMNRIAFEKVERKRRPTPGYVILGNFELILNSMKSS